jgi:predicted site-specific integrase-resolvase
MHDRKTDVQRAACGEKTVSIKKAGELAGVCKKTIYNWMEAGKIEFVRNASGHVRIFASTLFKSGSDRDAAKSDNG